MGSIQAISELASQLNQMRSEMIFIDPSDEATLIAFNKQAEEIVASLLAKGEGLGRYITFLKGEQKVIEAEADEWKAVAQKTANRAKAVDATIKWLMENPIRNVIVSTNKPLMSDTRKFQIVKNPPAYRCPGDTEDYPSITVGYLMECLNGNLDDAGDSAELLINQYMVTPEPYIDWAGVKTRMREIRRIMTDDKEREKYSNSDLEAMEQEWIKLSRFVTVTQTNRVQMY